MIFPVFWIAGQGNGLDVRLSLARLSGLGAILALVAVTAPVHAQRLNVSHYDAGDGLPSSRVLSIVQDATGYLWFGTDSGLARYDGTRFRPVPLGPGIPGTEIVALVAVDDEIVFATSAGGFGAVQGLRSRPLVAGEVAGTVRAVSRDPQGGLLVAGTMGAATFRGGDGRVLTPRAEVPAGCCGVVLRDQRGRLWVGGRDGLYRVQGGKYVSVGDGLPAGASVEVLVEDQGGTLWAGGSSGLYRQVGEVFAPVGSGARQPVLAGARVGNELWFGTSNGALRVRAGTVERLGPGSGLGTASVNAVLADYEGNVWLGTESGVAKWTASRFVTFAQANGLADEFVVDVAGADGRVLVASRYGVVSIDPGDGSLRHEVTVDAAGSIHLTAIAALDGGLLVGTNHGLIVRDRDGDEARALASRAVTALRAAGDGAWVGTTAGLFRLEGGRLQPAVRDGPLAAAAIADVELDGAGRVWVATSGDGVWILEGGSFRPFEFDGDAQPGTIVDLSGHAAGVWAATHGTGAWRLGADGAVSSLSRSGNGLASDFVRTVVVGRAGEVWLCTNRGLDRWHAETGMSHFDLADGIAALGCNPRAGALDSSGAVWLGTPLGLTREVGAPAPRPLPPTVVIGEVLAGGSPVSPPDLLGLAPGRSDVHIEYSALTFLDEASTRFQYRLLGRSDAWSRPTTERSVSFVGLAPGEYLFQVQAISEAGLWSAAPAQVHFVIEPNFWQTTWFQVTVALLLIGAVVLAFHRRLRSIEDERQQLRVMVDRRTRELVEKNSLLERMATTDELTGLANRRFFLDTLERELRKLTRISTDQQLSLLVIDLDRFKSVNDRYGHATGDAVLRHVAQRLAQGVRATDLPARYGGEEFAILLPDTHAQGAEFLAEKLRHDVEASPVRHDGVTISVTISVGVATIDAPRRYSAEVEADLIHRADEAMYEAKSGGRNRVVVAPAAQPSE